MAASILFTRANPRAFGGSAITLRPTDCRDQQRCIDQQALKGSRPIQSERARARIVSALAFVDAVITFDAETPIDLITDLKPNVLIKSADYKVEGVVGRSVVESNGGRVVLVPLMPNSTTTRIVEKMRVVGSKALV